MALKNNSTGNTVIDDGANAVFTVAYYNKLLPMGPGGQSYGYLAGGYLESPAGATNSVERFAFVTSTPNMADVGDLSTVTFYGSGTNSFEYGFKIGGIKQPYPSSTHSSIIDRWPFAGGAFGGLQSAQLTQARGYMGPAKSPSYGYAAGGYDGTDYDIIDRWPFASFYVNASDVGNLTTLKPNMGGCNSLEYGYIAGGNANGSYLDVIERWPFAESTTNSSDVGDLIAPVIRVTGANSPEYGYITGGLGVPPTIAINSIERWPFATGTTDASDVGDLSDNMWEGAGSSHESYGYAYAGLRSPVSPAPGYFGGGINSWPFATGTTDAVTGGTLYNGNRRMLHGDQINY